MSSQKTYTLLPFSSASWRMRLKIRCDCTAEPPGEFTTTATVGSFDRPNALLIGSATEARARPGRSGVTMPIGPMKCSTGTTGPRLKKSIPAVLVGTQALQSVTICAARPLNSRLRDRVTHVQRRPVPQDCLDLRPEAVIGLMQDEARPQLQGRPAALDGP